MSYNGDGVFIQNMGLTKYTIYLCLCAAVGTGSGDRGAAQTRCISEHDRGPISPLHGAQHTLQ